MSKHLRNAVVSRVCRETYKRVHNTKTPYIPQNQPTQNLFYYNKLPYTLIMYPYKILILSYPHTQSY